MELQGNSQRGPRSLRGDTRLDILVHMEYIHHVSHPLCDFVDFLWLSEGYIQTHGAERVLPTGSMDLVVDLDARSGIDGILSGARTACSVLDTSRPLNLIGVRFKAGGGFAFFEPSPGALQDLRVPLDSLWGRAAQNLREKLWQASTPEAKFRVLEFSLLGRLNPKARGHPAVQYAVKAFSDSPASVRVADVVERTGFSARHFIAVFRDQVGLAPKQFNRICRFRQVIRNIDSTTEVDWADTAAACGYFDQAHFIHDFRAFAGATPSSYVLHRTAHPNHIRIAD